MLVAVDLSRLDGFVQLVGIDEGLALDFENLYLALVDEAVEGGAADFEVLASFFAGVVTLLLFLGILDIDLVDGFYDDGFEDVFYKTTDCFCV